TFRLRSGLYPAMDSVDSNPVQRELSVQGKVLDHHESMMKHIMTEQTAMRQVLANIQGMLLTAPGTSAKNPQPTPREHTLPVPEMFDGDITKSRGFLMQCSLIFRQQTQAYGSDCTGWAENALRGAFLNCLNEEIKRKLATKELPKSLSALINMCIQLDNHMRKFGRQAGEGRRPAGGANMPTGLLPSQWREEEEDPAEDEEQPMQLGRARFGASHRRRRQSASCVEEGDTGPIAKRVKESARQ
uniref:Uncharacterized protein n=1 Tax=Haplochromis burtoni TaxID=8153 RepID=A0A3Q2WFF6_HAPBU